MFTLPMPFSRYSLEGIFTVENDIFYQLGEMRGMKKGLEKGLQKSLEKSQSTVRNLLLTTDFSISRIAALAGVSEYFVRKIKKMDVCRNRNSTTSS